MRARVCEPLDTLDIGQPWSRWPGVTARDRLDPKRIGRGETRGYRSGGHFFDLGSSRSVPIGHTTPITAIHDFSQQNRSRREKCHDSFGFLAS
ncbi:hypothetical protein PUN28_001064 [Cardiocondyla obscurior]|uniref:Uncharacterized protein n=1 Tax=Cardiocondyla obscurior TaxID=286306 RepID=A0AAW2H2P3_9HYME